MRPLPEGARWRAHPSPLRQVAKCSRVSAESAVHRLLLALRIGGPPWSWRCALSYFCVQCAAVA
jgi:hypothetical protein